MTQDEFENALRQRRSPQTAEEKERRQEIKCGLTRDPLLVSMVSIIRKYMRDIPLTDYEIEKYEEAFRVCFPPGAVDQFRDATKKVNDEVAP